VGGDARGQILGRQRTLATGSLDASSNRSFTVNTDLPLSCIDKYQFIDDPVPGEPLTPAAPWWRITSGSCAEAAAASSGLLKIRNRSETEESEYSQNGMHGSISSLIVHQKHRDESRHGIVHGL